MRSFEGRVSHYRDPLCYKHKHTYIHITARDELLSPTVRTHTLFSSPSSPLLDPTLFPRAQSSPRISSSHTSTPALLLLLSAAGTPHHGTPAARGLRLARLSLLILRVASRPTGPLLLVQLLAGYTVLRRAAATRRARRRGRRDVVLWHAIGRLKGWGGLGLRAVGRLGVGGLLVLGLVVGGMLLVMGLWWR